MTYMRHLQCDSVHCTEIWNEWEGDIMPEDITLMKALKKHITWKRAVFKRTTSNTDTGSVTVQNARRSKGLNVSYDAVNTKSTNRDGQTKDEDTDDVLEEFSKNGEEPKEYPFYPNGRHIGRGTNVRYSVRWYIYILGDDTVKYPSNIPENDFTYYWLQVQVYGS